MGLTPSKELKSVDLRSHPRNTLAHHLRECRMDPFPSPNEHIISWSIVHMSGGIIKCKLSGCEECELANVFLEKILDNDNKLKLALRRVISPTKTISIKFYGMENINLEDAVENKTLTSLLLVSITYIF